MTTVDREAKGKCNGHGVQNVQIISLLKRRLEPIQCANPQVNRRKLTRRTAANNPQVIDGTTNLIRGGEIIMLREGSSLEFENI